MEYETSGIYCIVNLENNKSYVGSSAPEINKKRAIATHTPEINAKRAASCAATWAAKKFKNNQRSNA